MTYVDDFGETFSRHWKTGDWTYKTSDKTAFRLGCKKAAFSDLKVGEMDENRWREICRPRVLAGLS